MFPCCSCRRKLLLPSWVKGEVLSRSGRSKPCPPFFLIGLKTLHRVLGFVDRAHRPPRRAESKAGPLRGRHRKGGIVKKKKIALVFKSHAIPFFKSSRGRDKDGIIFQQTWDCVFPRVCAGSCSSGFYKKSSHILVVPNLSAMCPPLLASHITATPTGWA